MKTLPNLDTMTPDELKAFWATWHVTTPKKAEKVLGKRKYGHRVMETAACYAINKACAIDLRAGGEIKRAMVYEEACEIQYGKLPKDVRW